MTSFKVHALLPMKGHSERVPNKNLKLFNGKPLYHQIMETLLACNSIENIWIDTDSEEIKKDASANFERVNIIDRPIEIQGDFVSMNTVIAYDLSVIDGEYFIQTHSTNPLIKSSTIESAIQLFQEKLPEIDSVFSVTKLYARLYYQDLRPVNHDPESLIRTQDLPPLFEENSNFYIFSKESFNNAKNKRIGDKPSMYEVDYLEAVDIDNPQDFKLAETLHHQLNSI